MDYDLVKTLKDLSGEERRAWLDEQQIALHQRLAKLVGLGNGQSVQLADLDVKHETLRGITDEIAAVVECLRMIDEGTFGRCAEPGCKKFIPLARMKAFPGSTMCVDCQRKNQHGVPAKHPRRTLPISKSKVA